MNLKQFLDKAEQRFQAFFPGRTSDPGLLSAADRRTLQGHVEAMQAAARVQTDPGLTALDQFSRELAEDRTLALLTMSPGAFRSPRGLEAKGELKALQDYRPGKLVELVIQRGVGAQRRLNEDNERRRQLQAPARAERR